MQTRNFLVLAGTALSIFALYMVIPVYQPQIIGESSEGVTGVLQHNRFTGTTYLLQNGSWERIEYPEAEPTPEPSERLPESAESEVEGWGGLRKDFQGEDQVPFSADLYNGSSWKLTGIRIGMVAVDSQEDTVWTRSYMTDVDVKPGSTGYLEFQVLTGEKFETIKDWFILGIWGKKREEFQDIEW